LKIVVCIKSVRAALLLQPGKKYAINPYDICALEEAVKLKKSTQAEVICLIMGVADQRIAAELKKFGADRIIFVSDTKFAGADTLATTYTLSKAINKIGQVDLVLCGDHAIDGETGHVGAGLAKRLGFDFLSNVDYLEVEEERLMCICRDKTYHYTYEIESGMVLAVVNCMIKEVTLSIMQIKRINSVAYEVWDASELAIDVKKCGLLGSRTKVADVEQMDKRNARKATILNMGNKEDLQQLLKILGR
jgi:electron transfer flavoprotein beta subunit